jgi:hypothetical protein
MKDLGGNSQELQWIIGLFAVMRMLTLASCVYLPVVHTSGERGIAEDNFSWIRVGETTKEEILHTFGCPTEVHPIFFLYKWKITTGYWIFGIGGGYRAAGAVGSTASYKQLRIWFDTSGRVTETIFEKKYDIETKWATG